ncbi:MAG: VWA domain-containing protein [Sporocytophaga sp.]|nr:VWA domain-containing protein [Sporocytophaga sp.]
MFKRYLKGAALAALIFFWSLSANAQNDLDRPEKGKLSENITLPQPALGKVVSVYKSKDDFSSWNVNGFKVASNALSTREYGSNASYKATSGAIQIPAVNQGEDVFLQITDEFSIESDYDKGRILVSADGGNTWDAVYTVSGKISKRNTSVNLTRYAGKSVVLALDFTSDESFESKGWTVFSLGIVKGTVTASSGSNMRVMAGETIKITGVNTSNFPEYVYVDFEYRDASGNPINTLNLSQIDLDAILPGSTPTNDKGTCDLRLYVPGGNNRPVDIMFLIDNSGSMSDEQAQVKANIQSFISKINAPGSSVKDVAFGMLRFGNPSPLEVLEKLPGSKGLPNDNYTQEENYYIGELQARNVTTGGIERGYDALALALTANARPNAQKIYILVTDENATGSNLGPTTKAQIISQLQAQNAIVYSWIPSTAEYNATYADVATQTGGKRFDILSNIDGLTTDIAKAINGTYTLRYCPFYTIYDATVHTATISINGVTSPPKDSKDWTATPLQEYIYRDAATSAGQKVAWAVNSSGHQLCFDAIDNVGPYGTSGTLSLRPNGSTGAWTTVTMTQMTVPAAATTKWCGTVPPSVVLSPGIDYYATVKYADGHELKSPPTKEAFFAWGQAVLPNHGPIITLTGPSAPVNTCSPVNITFTVEDNTNGIQDVKLYYRESKSLAPYTEKIIFSYVSGVRPTIQNHSVSVPVTGIGLDYYISATDNFGLSGHEGDPALPKLITTLNQSYVANSTNFMYLTIQNTVKIECAALKVGDVITAYYLDDCGQLAVGGKLTVSNATLAKQTVTIYGKTPTTRGFSNNQAIMLKVTRGTKVYDIEHPGMLDLSPGYINPATNGGVTAILNYASMQVNPNVTKIIKYTVGNVSVPYSDQTPTLVKGTRIETTPGVTKTPTFKFEGGGCVTPSVTADGIWTDNPGDFTVSLNIATQIISVSYSGNTNNAKGIVSVSTTDGDVYEFAVEGISVTCTKVIRYNVGNVLVADGDITPSTTEGTDFGTVSVAKTNAFTLTGTGCSPAIAISSVSVNNTADFTVTYSGTSINVTYKALNDASATVTVQTNQGAYKFDVQGKKPACVVQLKYGTVVIKDGDNSPSTAEGTDFGISNVQVPRTFTLTGTGCTPPAITSVSSNDPSFLTSFSGSNVTVTYKADIDAVGTITVNMGSATYIFDVKGLKQAKCAVAASGATITPQFGQNVSIFLDPSTNTSLSGTFWVSGRFINAATGIQERYYPPAEYSKYYPYWSNYIGSGNGSALPAGTYYLILEVTNNGTCSGAYTITYVVQ